MEEEHDADVGAGRGEVVAQPGDVGGVGALAQTDHVEVVPVPRVARAAVALRDLCLHEGSAPHVVIADALVDGVMEPALHAREAVHRLEARPLPGLTKLREIARDQHPARPFDDAAQPGRKGGAGDVVHRVDDDLVDVLDADALGGVRHGDLPGVTGVRVGRDQEGQVHASAPRATGAANHGADVGRGGDDGTRWSGGGQAEQDGEEGPAEQGRGDEEVTWAHAPHRRSSADRDRSAQLEDDEVTTGCGLPRQPRPANGWKGQHRRLPRPGP